MVYPPLPLKQREKPWMAIRRARKDHPCDIHGGDELIRKDELYEHHFHHFGNNFRVCRECSIHPELFKLNRPLNFEEVTELLEKQPKEPP